MRGGLAVVAVAVAVLTVVSFTVKGRGALMERAVAAVVVVGPVWWAVPSRSVDVNVPWGCCCWAAVVPVVPGVALLMGLASSSLVLLFKGQMDSHNRMDNTMPVM